MKHALLLFSFLTTSLFSWAQLTINPNKTASYLANKLVATSGTLGVAVTNAVLTCDSNANGEFSGISNLGIADGIALGTGDVASNSALNSYGLDGYPSDFASSTNNAAGDVQLNAIVMANTFDACVLEFDMQPVGSFIEFEYVFGSEEYPEFNCSVFNDVFGFLISGPGFSAPTNIALIPSTTTAVSINSINDGSVLTCSPNTALYVNNTDTICTMDGFTVPLIAHAAVTSGATYHLKLAIADVMDGVLNSYVILKANSLKSGGTNPTDINAFSTTSGIEAYPTVIKNECTINNLGKSNWVLELDDMNGRIIGNYSISANQDSFHLDATNLSTGIYILKAQRESDKLRFVQRLIKE